MPLLINDQGWGDRGTFFSSVRFRRSMAKLIFDGQIDLVRLVTVDGQIDSSISRLSIFGGQIDLVHLVTVDGISY